MQGTSVLQLTVLLPSGVGESQRCQLTLVNFFDWHQCLQFLQRFDTVACHSGNSIGRINKVTLH